MEGHKLISSINFFHTKNIKISYRSIKWLIGHALTAVGKPFQKYNVTLPSITASIKYTPLGLIFHPTVAAATSRRCYHLISSSKIGPLRRSEGG